jgi:hypothetical protein
MSRGLLPISAMISWQSVIPVQPSRIAFLIGRSGATQRATGMNHSFLICGSMLRPVASWQTRLLAETPVAVGSGRFQSEGRWPPLSWFRGDWKCAGRGRLALRVHLGGPARIDLWCLSLRPARCLFTQGSTGATLERHSLLTRAGLSIWQGNYCTDSRMRAYGCVPRGDQWIGRAIC